MYEAQAAANRRKDSEISQLQERINVLEQNAANNHQELLHLRARDNLVAFQRDRLQERINHQEDRHRLEVEQLQNRLDLVQLERNQTQRNPQNQGVQQLQARLAGLENIRSERDRLVEEMEALRENQRVLQRDNTQKNHLLYQGARRIADLEDRDNEHVHNSPHVPIPPPMPSTRANPRPPLSNGAEASISPPRQTIQSGEGNRRERTMLDEIAAREIVDSDARAQAVQETEARRGEITQPSLREQNLNALIQAANARSQRLNSCDQVDHQRQMRLRELRQTGASRFGSGSTADLRMAARQNIQERSPHFPTTDSFKNGIECTIFSGGGRVSPFTCFRELFDSEGNPRDIRTYLTEENLRRILALKVDNGDNVASEHQRYVESLEKIADDLASIREYLNHLKILFGNQSMTNTVTPHASVRDCVDDLEESNPVFRELFGEASTQWEDRPFENKIDLLIYSLFLFNTLQELRASRESDEEGSDGLDPDLFDTIE